MDSPFPIVRVVWLDAWTSTNGVTVKKAKKNKPVWTVSVGFLIAENEDGVTLAMDTHDKEKKGGKSESFIGWGMIEKYDELIFR